VEWILLSIGSIHVSVVMGELYFVHLIPCELN
jgi:hypothetical protein